MELIRKSDVELIDGRFVKDGKVIEFEYPVASKWNNLERDYQTAGYVLYKHEKMAERFEPIEDFKFESQYVKYDPQLTVNTPLLDEQVERSKAIAEELDNKMIADAANKYAIDNDLAGLIEWLEADLVFACEAIHGAWKVDSVTLGNPLFFDPHDEDDTNLLKGVLAVIGRAIVLER